LLIVLVIIIVVFGTKRLKNVGSDLGSAIKSFRSAIREEEEKETSNQHDDDKPIDGEVASKKSDND
jgi:sec-independent protein translocase protein TatA